MLNRRVIPTLLIKDGGLVKTRKFKNPKYVGDPINAIKIFNEKEVDELIILDISASKEKKIPDYELINNIAGECFMPLCYGGGIRSIDDAAKIIDSGVEKVCLQSAVFHDASLITKIANRFGSQAVTLSVDVKFDWLGRIRLFNSSTEQYSEKKWLDFIRTGIDAGIGEVMLNCVDNDGELNGYNIEIIELAVKNFNVPIIASGGAGKLEDFESAILAGASAVAAGAMFVFHGPHRAVLISYPPYEDLENIINMKSE
jgi:cyclase